MGLLEQQLFVDEMNGEGLVVPPDIEPLEFLMAVYRDPRQPMSRRMRAAEAAAQYRHPRLAATAVFSGDDFGERLEKAIQRSGVRPRLIEARAGAEGQVEGS
jgi:hypothetical protein